MSSRDEILSALRRNAPALRALPDLPHGIIYADPVAQFEKVFGSVGGRCIRVSGLAGLAERIKTLEIVRTARTVASLVPGVPGRGIDLTAVKDPHDLAALDVSILPAELGVAENGAVWIPGSTMGPHRAVFVIAQHVILALQAGSIVSNMHQAYERVRIEHPGFGLFLSGPSKTADIEQSLVVGAHGARSCTMLLVES